MSADRRFTFKITAEVVDTEGKKMFDSHVTYENMAYEDVTLVEKHVIGMFAGLNQEAEKRGIATKKT